MTRKNLADLSFLDLTKRATELRSKIRSLNDEVGQWVNADLDDGQRERIKRLDRGINNAEAELAQVRAEQTERLNDPAAHGIGLEPAIPKPDGNRSTSLRGPLGDVRSNALRAIDRDTTATDDQKHAATLLVEHDGSLLAARWAAAAADPHYLTGFAKLVRDPQRGHLEFTDRERAAYGTAQTEARAMSLTDAAGGYMVPLSLDPAIMVTDAGAIDPVRQLARTVTTVTDQWQGVTSAGASTRWAAEASEANDDAPTLASAPIPVHKADSFVPYSIEVGMDAVDLVNELRRIMLEQKAEHEAAAWINGTGSGQPTGIVTALDGTSSELSPATAEAFAAADVYSTIEAVPPRFRANASWLAELSTINQIDQFETTGGDKLFPGVALQEPVLLRRRLFEASEVDAFADIDTGATADNFLLICGDLRQYVIADRVGATVELVPHLFGTTNGRPTGERGLYLYWRVGADVVIDNAFRVMNIATTA